MIRRLMLASIVWCCAWGCASPPPASSPTIVVAHADPAAPTIAVAPATDPEAATVRFPEHTRVQPGCLAWSPSRHKVACIVGLWATVSRAEGDPGVVMLTPDERDDIVTPMNERGELSEDVRRGLDAELVAGRYVALPPPIQLPENGRIERNGFTVRLVHRKVEGGGPSSAPRYDVEMSIQHGNKKPSITQRLLGVPCAQPDVRVRNLPGVGLLVERICVLADEGMSGVDAHAWLCSGTDCR